MTAPNWVRRPEAAARTLERRTATLGAAVARTVGAQEIAAIASFECKNDATRDVVAVEVLQLGQLEGGVKTRLRAMERVTDESHTYFQPDGVVFWSVETRPTDVFKLNPRCSGSHTRFVWMRPVIRGSQKPGDRPRAKTPVRLFAVPTRPGDWNKMSPVAAQTHTVGADPSTEPCGARRIWRRRRRVGHTRAANLIARGRHLAGAGPR